MTSNPPRQDHYAVLGLQPTATTDDIAKKYKALALERHPDKGGSTAAFQLLNEAHEVLSDPARRSEHERLHINRSKSSISKPSADADKTRRAKSEADLEKIKAALRSAERRLEVLEQREKDLLQEQSELQKRQLKADKPKSRRSGSRPGEAWKGLERLKKDMAAESKKVADINREWNRLDTELDRVGKEIAAEKKTIEELRARERVRRSEEELEGLMRGCKT